MALVGEGIPLSLQLHGRPAAMTNQSGAGRASWVVKTSDGCDFPTRLPARTLASSHTPAEQADLFAALLDVLQVPRVVVQRFLRRIVTRRFSSHCVTRTE